MTTITNKKIGPIGYGLMGLTLRPTPQSQAFPAMRATLTSGSNFWNGGEIYGSSDRNSLHLLNEYFTKYPEDAEKVVLSIKGGYTPGGLRLPGAKPDGSPQNIKRSIDECLRVLDGKKFLDMFECARVDPDVPLETTLNAINEYVTAGKVGGISLSEVSAATIRRAAKVVKVVAVEVEVSLWATDIFTNGVAQACSELSIPIVAYSPIGRGFLTGSIKTPADIPADDFRKHLPKFQGEAFANNIKLVEEIEGLAKRKGVTPAQVGIAWLTALSGRKGNPVIIPIPGASSEGRVKENSMQVQLTDAELDEIEGILKGFVPQGGRYHDSHSRYLEG
jgi:pyridoxine 4-dehydrogenase